MFDYKRIIFKDWLKIVSSLEDGKNLKYSKLPIIRYGKNSR